MPDWTNSAKAELERYLTRVGANLAGSGADATEVTDDIRRHIDAEIATSQLRIVTEEDVRRMVARVGEPTPPPAGNVPPKPAPQEADFRRLESERPNWVTLFFSVILPAVAFTIEWETRMCASAFFDPMPTVWHELLVVSVPIINLATWIAVRREKLAWRRRLGFANGFAIGICLYYSLLYLPLILPGLIAIIAFGWGLLPLSPFLCLVPTIWLRARLRLLDPSWEKNPLRGLSWGLAGALVAVSVVVLPVSLTRCFENLAISDSPETARRGLSWLRAIGSRETLLRDCYRTDRSGFDLEIPFRLEGYPIHQEEARTLYYRVTGQPFDSVPPPPATQRSRDWALFDDFDWDTATDSGLGGESVAGRLKGLSLFSSRIDAKVEPDAALAYSEWTLEFKNDANVPREARAQILVPPGAVVSRLTLWVNGEEREAAFGGRSQVRTAYQNVAVVQRHDPVLVTTCGPDRILVQCFPVPPNGGRMKVRIGITEPMVLTATDSGHLRWPVLLERNFSIPMSLHHALWAESTESLKSNFAKLREDHSPGGKFGLRGELTDAELADPAASVIAKRDGGLRVVWAPHPGDLQVVRQNIIEVSNPPPSRLVMVVEGSIGMREFAPAVAAAIRQMPEGIEFTLMVASDTISTPSSVVQKCSRTEYDAIATAFAKTRMTGGQDNAPVLARAWDLAAESSAGVILWIHGPQPVLLTSADNAGLRQRFERHGGPPRLLEIQTSIGPDRVTESLDGLPAVASVPRFGKLEDDLAGLFSKWSGKTGRFVLARDLVDSSLVLNSPTVKEASEHVTRLWANTDVLRLAGKRKFEEATSLATTTHLVTPYSGAVVLENKAQYQTAGLTPVEAAKVPVVPEPGTWLLLLLGIALICAKSLVKKNLRA